MNRNLLIISVAIIGLLGAAGIYMLAGEDGADNPAALSGDACALDNQTRSGGGTKGFLSAGELERLIARGGPSPKARFEAYKSYARYPSNSRPLTAGMKDLTQPWVIKNVPLPIVADSRFATVRAFKQAIQELRNAGKSDEEIKAELQKKSRNAPRFVFQTNRHALTAGDELRAELTTTTADGAPLEPTILDARIIGDRRFGSKSLGSLSKEAKGKGVNVFTWKFPSADKKYWGQLEIQVRARIPGLNDEVILRQSVYGSPIAPATFTGNFQERLENGSLIIETELDVKRDCRYSLHANLYNQDTGEPTHWVSFDGALKPGRRIVKFTFFGKIFRDGGHEGRFALKNLRGTCENLPFPASWVDDPSKSDAMAKAKPLNEPLQIYIPFNTITHKTEKYRLEQFSTREWDSPYKRRRLERLKYLASRVPGSN